MLLGDEPACGQSEHPNVPSVPITRPTQYRSSPRDDPPHVGRLELGLHGGRQPFLQARLEDELLGEVVVPRAMVSTRKAVEDNRLVKPTMVVSFQA